MSSSTRATPPVTAAADVLAEAVAGVEAAVRDVHAHLQRAMPDPPRVNRYPVRRARAAWLLTIPGAAAEFLTVVPESHLEPDGAVRCVCGARVEIRPGDLEECREPHPDGLMRCFLRTEASVRVARWEVGC